MVTKKSQPHTAFSPAPSSTSEHPRKRRSADKSKTKTKTKNKDKSTDKIPFYARPTDPLTAAKAVLLCIVCICTLSIASVFIVDLCFNPERDAKNTIERLADDYYIDYLYPNTLGTHLDDPATVLSEFTDVGYPTVRLRQLLFTNDANASAAEYVSNKYYRCDTNQTTLRYYPVAPYGPRDYTVTINYTCENFRSID